MGWYDAYRGNNVSRVNIAPVTSDNGSAAQSFGDAFQTIGSDILKVDKQRRNDALINAQTNLQDTKQKAADFTLKGMQESDNQKKIDDAFKSDYMNFKNESEFNKHLQNDNIGGFELASAPAKAAQADWFKQQDTIAQGKFNDAAIESSVVGGYKNMKSFVDANPELVKSADGVTMAKIDKYFAGKDNSAAKLDAKKSAADTATKLLKMQAKLNKAGKGKGGFKYDASVDSKIAAQVKTAMGMDAPDFNFDDRVKKEYQDTVAGAAEISKKYNLEPSLAIHVYENPDLYEFTADGKVIQATAKKENKKTPEKSWQAYQ